MEYYLKGHKQKQKHSEEEPRIYKKGSRLKHEAYNKSISNKT